MIHVMPTVNGPEVRHRAAERGWDLARLASETGIPHGTLRNATRDREPQELSLPRIYEVSRVLARPGETPRQLVDELMTGRNDGVPSNPPSQPKPPKKEPGRKDDPKGPKRATGAAA